MKKFYSFVLFALLSVSAFAETDDAYYWFYDKVVADPTGKGKVYISDGPLEDGEFECQDDMEFKYVNYGLNTLPVWTYEEPAEGYQFVGWFTKPSTEASMADKVSDGNGLSITTTVSSESNDVEYYPFEPEATYYGVFGKVKIQAASAMDNLGTLSISKLANDAGDEITITATPASADAEFAYWMDEEGNKITENPYTFTVEGIKTYTVYYTGDAVKYIDFGEGKYIPFSNSRSARLSDGITKYEVNSIVKTFEDLEGHTIGYEATENAWGWIDNEVYDDQFNLISYEFHPYQGEIPNNIPSYSVSGSVADYVAGNGAVLYGKGILPVVLYDDESAYVSDMDKLVATCTGAVDIANLPTKDGDDNDIVYYVFQENAFVKATSGTVAKDECYLMLDATDYPLPEKIYLDESEDPKVGVAGVAVKKAPVFKGVYTINGQQVTAPVKGLNIVGGQVKYVK